MNTNLSVILPTYNRSELLPRSIKSVLNQTYKNLELIIVDDGSTDNTEEVVKGFDDPRIVYIKNKKNLGATASRNVGIRFSKADFIAFQDSDDEWIPKKLEKQINAFEQSPLDLGVVYTGFYRISNNNKEYIPQKHVIVRDGYIHEELFNGNFITTPSILLKKECFKKSGFFDEKLPRLQDWDLVLRLSKYYKFKFIEEPLLISYYTDDSITSNNKLYGKAMEIIISKYIEDFKNSKKVLGKHLFDTGIHICTLDNFQKGRSYLQKAVMQTPLNMKYFFVFLISLFGQKLFLNFVYYYKKIKIF